MNRLVITTPSEREFAMTREFDAPRDLVFEAMTQPEFVRRWLYGPEGWSMPRCEIDARPGGTYRYEWVHEDGTQMAMEGTYLEVVPPERIVQTEKFDEAWYPGEALLTSTLTESNGRTTLVTVVRYDSQEIRDGVLRSPMESGVALSYDRLEALVKHN